MATRSTSRQYVTFFLMEEEYSVAIEHVREIIECEPLTRIPSMPPIVRGVINLRGNVVPVIDLPVKFGQPQTALDSGTYLVIVDLEWSGESVRLGLLTRVLGQVIDLRDDEIKPVPDFGTRIQVEYLRGIGRVESRFVMLLDVDRLLSPAELVTITALDPRQAPGASGPAESTLGSEGEV
jgi:purine-binding chemotaxis protein CheW